MEIGHRSPLSQALLLAFAGSLVLALVFALSALELSASSGSGLSAGSTRPPPSDSSPGGAPLRGLRLADIPARAGAIVPPASDDRPRTFKPSKPGACLKFIHIPKAGGSTIEAVWRSATPQAHAKNSGWARTDSRATCTGNKPGDSRTDMFPQEKRRRCKVPGGTCNYFHTPPRHDPLLWKTGYEKCDTFCIARHPLDKFESEWQYRTRQSCETPEGRSNFTAWAREKLDLLSRGNLYIDDCHLLPTNKYVYQANAKSGAQRTCKHILRFERLDEDFSALMKAYKYPLALDGEVRNSKDTCMLDIPDDVLAGVRLVYAGDFGLFGYD